mmetsp:Transcript_4373/g.6782  ORF Transcript_4373/g.6782 Transcript_4373/m.6782 type:complete len:2348 (+) Transcript_4373:52-7095(+)
MAELAEYSENISSNTARSLTKSVVCEHSHRRFATVEAYVSELGGEKSRIIEKVLIANNGVGAVKAIRSIRQWAYQIFGNERAISFVVMATPEDLRANAEYIRMADVIVDVPGGSNNHNYANVTLIVELARLHGVHAVWAGWGHASENPLLPETLEKSNPPIKFIGPAGPPMKALGDKIGSTIIAQSAGVPCISWNGDSVTADYDQQTGTLPDSAFEEATIHTATEACEAANRIGFPIMIKASEGGGGKGIRRVDKQEDVLTAYRQVCGEVPGSPIFIMKLASNSRHLEVQLLADEYGSAVALNGRDCSVQRRHQKIIEEGPPLAAPPDVWSEMEKAAVSLAKAVGYTNAGTVEYLYSETDSKFYFLELNPRLQVEHPVTEMITRVNLPAAQLQVAMGLPLHNIPEIRELYGRDRFETDTDASTIDFDTAIRNKAAGHCIAVRITAENAEAGFKPTSGGIQELNFRSTPSVWGYFSMDSSGSIHEFADSQFGHLFASGIDREQARRNMVLALKELSIRGDISTTVDYISNLIELEDFIENRITTGWLDELIKQNVEGIGAAEDNKPTLNNHLYVVLGGLIAAYDLSAEGEKQFLDSLSKGQLPPQSLMKMAYDVELILAGVKYRLRCTCKGPNTFQLALADDMSTFVTGNVRTLSDGGYLLEIGGKSHVAYLTSKADVASGMRMNVGGANIAFSPDYDPTSLRTDVAGKLVKRLVPDGAKVKKGEPFAEIEVMKMFMPLKVEEAGVITWNMNEGAALAAGDLLASLELENPENVAPVSVFSGDLAVSGWGVKEEGNKSRPYLMLCHSIEKIKGGMAGYTLSESDIAAAIQDLEFAAMEPVLPIMEIGEQLSVLSGRMCPKLFATISEMVESFKSKCAENSGSGMQLRFPAESVVKALDDFTGQLSSEAEKAAFKTLTKPLFDSAEPYTKSHASGVPGSEKVMSNFLQIMRDWVLVERWFCDGKSYADAVDNLRRAFSDEHCKVLQICRAHAGLDTTSYLISRIITMIGDASRIDAATSVTSPIGKRVSILTGAESLSLVSPTLSEIGAMKGMDQYVESGRKARMLLYQESMPSSEERKQNFLEATERIFKRNSGSLKTDGCKDISAFFADHLPLGDILFPLLKSFEDSQKEVAFLEVCVRSLYKPYTLNDFKHMPEERLLRFSFQNKTSESAIVKSAMLSSFAELKKFVSSNSLGSLDKPTRGLERRESDGGLVQIENREKISSNTIRTGAILVLDSIVELNDTTKMGSALSSFPQSIEDDESGPVNVLYIFVLNDDAPSQHELMDEIAIKCQQQLCSYVEVLRKAGIRRVTVFCKTEPDGDIKANSSPASFTYRYPKYEEEELFRNIEPSHMYHLELNRVAQNFNVTSLGSQQTTACNVHLYQATPKSSALANDKKANKSPRVFARAITFTLAFSSSSFEHVLVDALNAVDVAAPKSKLANHLFINLANQHEMAVLDPIVVEQVVVDILKRHSERIIGLGIVEVETRVTCCLSPGSPAIALRLVASNPTGFVHVMSTYVEAADDGDGELVFKLIGGTKASFASSGDSSWEGISVDSPYPLTRPFDAQRNAASRSSDTLYCYDIPALFEAAVEQQWTGLAGQDETTRPLMVMYTKELVVQRKDKDASASWTIQDYLDGNLDIVQMNRRAGANDVGMVAWLMILKTVEYPDGRQVVLIANDITHKAGSFGTREDVVFKLASEFARQQKIPRLYVAANSGARIGLAEKVKKTFKVAFKDPMKPENGFDFIYVTKDDYHRLTETKKHEIIAEEASYNNETVYKITDIIGSEPDLGVENLKGSGLIAGETSAAYDDIFTLTLVLGRTVGIGAYLVRLGQRTIQKATASPIILTGYQALNKLMGVDVYSTNDQLGGPGIMYPNGVSHLVEKDHLSVIKSAIHWLSYVPSSRGGILPVTDIRGIDEIERSVEFTPTAGAPYDPRFLLEGKEESGVWQSGFFDKGSFAESLTGWAKTVIIGRARLGGIPMGVVVTENRTAEAIKPADPADLKASEAVIQEAGCVWFPNSAYKTAQAINDFRTEDLPLIVFANWRGFSGGQRDMFDEVLKYGSLIVDAFVAYTQPVFVFIPPHAEIRGGAWVVLDASINASCMEMYASAKTARGGVLEANGAASVKYRKKDLLVTMHRLDHELITLDKRLGQETEEGAKTSIKNQISTRENALLPVYEQIAVQFCELHDTPGRMKAVGVVERVVEWSESRAYFYWRLRRKLAEFDLRKKIVEAAEVGRGVKAPTVLEASALIKEWFIETPGMTDDQWSDDKVILAWMGQHHSALEEKIMSYTKSCVAEEVAQVLTAGGTTGRIGTSGIVEGLGRAFASMGPEEKSKLKKAILEALQ